MPKVQYNNPLKDSLVHIQGKKKKKKRGRKVKEIIFNIGKFLIVGEI